MGLARRIQAEAVTYRTNMAKLRTPTPADMENAERWLFEAQRNLRISEYYRVKQLCKQVIRALQRKETEK